MKQTIVIFPPPGLADMHSMVEFGKLILHHYPHNFSITILCTHGLQHNPTMSSYIQRISNSNPSISFHLFPCQRVDTPPSRRRVPAILLELIRLNLPNARNALLEISKTSKVRALIIHLICMPALSVGIELGIPTFNFRTAGASALAFFLNFPKIHQQTNDSFKNLTDTVFQIPGCPPLKATHMPRPLLDREDPAYWDFLNCCLDLPKVNGIIVNTFDGFEQTAMKAIQDGLCDGATTPVYYVGPLIASNEKEEGKANIATDQEEEYMSWLDKQPSGSVVFLYFGGMGTLSEKQVREIASGLEYSGTRFLWVLKKPSDDKSKMTQQMDDFDVASILPDGFTERTKGLGVVVKSQAPQLEVLKKESVGGFVTHCGWESVMEASVTGVPMIAWPLYAEQHVNRNALVEDMKMAIPVEQREEDGFVTATELETRVRELMESETGRELRERSRKMKEMGLAAFGDSGSSKLALKRLMDAISTYGN
ncbi:hypothetical protein FNV43_RR20502 [Rhamnella rubrinervis]|uniref:Glycosyltransferase n=1 Tax=Rhamnella rubrinervis TaxID=2594499 RepID=A0A8K0DZT9_9ROSA|nr:hypothetical protein FNV43_RR20502 [Rhamnella rubrinervis]